MEIKKIFVFLIASMLVATVPLVLAKTQDTLVITFDPNGDIDIDVNNATHAFGIVLANTWSNTTGGYLTLYNNGTVNMNTAINCSNVTQEGDMSLNLSTSAPQQDEYAVYIDGLTVSGYLNQSLTTTAYHSAFQTNQAPNDPKTFDVCLLIGVNLSANHTTQTTTLYFYGTQS